MNRQDLQQRTKQFHIDIIKLCRALPKDVAGYETARQLIRAAGSVAANYRATNRSKSAADFINKTAIVLEEADESLYWLEVVRDAGLKNDAETTRLIQEANEITAIFAAANKTAKLRFGKNNQP